MLEALLDRPVPPGEVDGPQPARSALVALRCLEELFRGIGPAVEDDVLADPAELGVDVVIDRESAGIHDRHVHAGGDRVIEEHRVHRGADRLIAAEGKGEVRHPARDMGMRQVRLDPARRIDEVDGVVGVLPDPGGDGEAVGIEDNVLRREPNLVDEDPIGPPGDVDLPLIGVGLALLVEGHHDDDGAVAAHLPRHLAEGGLALFHRDRIDDRLALDAFQPGLDDRPFRRIDHDRNAGDVGLGGDQVEESDHRLLGIEKALVHVDVEDLGAIGDLIARHVERGRIVAVADDLAELDRAGDVGPLADIDEGRGALGHSPPLPLCAEKSSGAVR